MSLKRVLLAVLLLCAAVARSQTAAAQGSVPGAPPEGASAGVSLGPGPSLAQGPFTSSVPAKPEPGVLHLSLQDALDRGLKQNLGLLLSGENVRVARGERWRELSALLPNITSSTYIDESQVDLAEFGFTFKSPSFTIPSVVGPFTYFDTRAYLTQAVFDWRAINAQRAAAQNEKSAQHTYQDARGLVLLAVGYSYLQAIADQARVETATAQVQSAQAVYDQASDRVKAGTSPAIDGLRAQVELKTRQQQLIQARNDFAIRKLALGRVIGLAPGQEFELTDKSIYRPFPGITTEEALKRAYSSRSDFQAALADVRAAELSRKAAEAGNLPSLAFTADYGLAASYPNTTSHGVFDVRATLTIPIFSGGRTHGEVFEADARLQQARQRLDNLRGQIDAEVRSALLNLESAEQQVAVAESNVDLADQTLTQARDRFAAGVTDTVEVVQAQEAVASARESFISSLYSDNYAKISLARALGLAEQAVIEYLKGK